MWKSVLAVPLFAALATPAVAAQLMVSVTGTLTAQLNEHSGSNTGVDPSLGLGSQLVLTASFDSSLLIPWGSTGYSVAGFGDFATTGSSFWRIDGPNMTWQASDDESDGFVKVYTQYDNDVPTIREYGPAIIIQGDKVVGLVSPSCLSPAGSSARPELCLGSSVGSQTDYQVDGVDHFMNPFSVRLSDQLVINAINGRWGDFYNTPGFTGTWDFANSSVVDPPTADVFAVPEPAVWIEMLAGMFLLGTAVRTRRVWATLP